MADRRLTMRKALNLLTWVLVIAAVTGVLYLASPPDIEAGLGIPACAGRPHTGPCRLCANPGRVKLPRVINAYNVHLRPIAPGAGVALGRPSF